MARRVLCFTAMFDRSTRVADIVLENAATASVFDRCHIDYCCRGTMALERACDDKGLDVERILNELSAVAAEPPQDVDPRTASTSALIHRVIAHQHRDLRATLSLLSYSAANLARRRHDLRIVRQLRTALEELSTRVMTHLEGEENDLFPALLVTPVTDATRGKLGVMFDDHREITGLLRGLREATSDYAALDIIDSELSEFIAGLAELDALITRHHHVENHVLLPRFR